MTPYGGDRVRIDGETILLSSRLPKGWTARVERALNQSEFPGTAVLWDDAFYQVIKVDSLPAGMRYALQPWPEHHAMRVSERYDAESETRRAEEWRAAHARERKRRTVGMLAMFTGHLPAIVQERLASELGVLASRMTMMSFISQLGAIFALVAYVVIRVMKLYPVPMWAAILALFFLLEAGFRFLVAWTQTRPVGSSAGALAYIVYWLVTGRRDDASPFETPKGHAVVITATPDDRKLADSMTMREPLATLLPARDQERLRERHGYDYRRSARGVAGILLVFSILGIITSLHTRAIVSLFVAIGIAVEQLLRFAAFRRGPAGSVIGFAIRPLLRDLL